MDREYRIAFSRKVPMDHGHGASSVHDLLTRALRTHNGKTRALDNPQDVVLPFLKWAGGKRWLQPLALIMRTVPIRNYYEPFVGSGAIFFALHPKQAHLSDTNVELIDTYRALKVNACAVAALLSKHDRAHSVQYYYQIREHVPRTPIARAARFIYLNRTCWNGLYRVNRAGRFNTPIGSKIRAVLSTDNFERVAERLSVARLEVSDFETQIRRAERGDLVFADPPYTVRHKHNGFLKYNEQLFCWDDQLRLRDELVAAKKRGASVVCTNADHISVRRLYQDEFTLIRVVRHSAIAADSLRRGRFSELVAVA